MDIVHLLPDSVANQIAAGEVIQRPASVVKELMENAVDAGAGRIDVIVQDAGRTCIQVVDDGKGMSETDARLAFERHATSKITRAEDLFTLRTMGFRGEALPSIAAVSQVSLRTRTIDSELGTLLEIEGGRVLEQKPCVCAVGTNFEVRNIFFNIPARRKFLKSNHTELNNIMQEFERIALVNYSVSFNFTNDGTTSLRLMASNMRKRIVDLFGRKVGEDLVSVDVETTLVKVSGFVGRPESSRKKGAHQYFFVNGRYMRHPYFTKAVTEAFAGLIPDGEQIPFFLYLDIDPSKIDVNISPTKTEVKFENEPAIWQILFAGVRESLGRFSAAPTIDFNSAKDVDIPVMLEAGETVAPPKINVDKSYNPFVQDTPSAASRLPHATSVHRARTEDWDMIYEQLLSAKETKIPEQEATLFPEGDKKDTKDIVEIGATHFQYRGLYIVSASTSGIILVHQHRAHVRILYDKYMAQMGRRENVTQGLLFPELLNLSPSDAGILETIIDEIRYLGFDVTSLGGSSFSINGLPAGVEGLTPQVLIQDMVDSVRQGGQLGMEEYRHRIALSLAKSAAIVEGQFLTQEEMDGLMADLLTSSNPNTTPDGKGIIAVLSQGNIDKMFA